MPIEFVLAASARYSTAKYYTRSLRTGVSDKRPEGEHRVRPAVHGGPDRKRGRGLGRAVQQSTDGRACGGVPAIGDRARRTRLVQLRSGPEVRQRTRHRGFTNVRVPFSRQDHTQALPGKIRFPSTRPRGTRHRFKRNRTLCYERFKRFFFCYG